MSTNMHTEIFSSIYKLIYANRCLDWDPSFYIQVMFHKYFLLFRLELTDSSFCKYHVHVYLTLKYNVILNTFLSHTNFKIQDFVTISFLKQAQIRTSYYLHEQHTKQWLKTPNHLELKHSISSKFDQFLTNQQGSLIGWERELNPQPPMSELDTLPLSHKL